MYFEVSKYKNEYDSYKYVCDDKTYSMKYGKKFFEFIQSNIPEYIHPNMITISSLIVMLFGFTIENIFSGILGSIIFSIGMIYYMISDSVDGIHARKTKQTSIIGEYLDHVGDVVIFGLIIDQVLNSLTDNLIIKRNLTLLTSLYFIKTHFDSIEMKKIIFDCNSGYLNKIININIFDSVIFSYLPLGYYINILTNILKNKTNDDYLSLNKFDATNSYIFTIYYFLKMLIVYYGNVNSFLSINLVDSYMMLCLINTKVFQVPIDYKVIILILLYYFNPLIVSIFAVIYSYYLIINIATTLNIKLI